MLPESSGETRHEIGKRGKREKESEEREREKEREGRSSVCLCNHDDVFDQFS